MHAITIPTFGGPEVLTLADVPTPEPAAGEVRIKVAAAGVNRADLLQRQGFYPPPPGESDLPGLEVSGAIDAVGDAVTDWRVGDEVCALLAGGGYAEYVTVPAGQVLRVPAGVDVVTAAALPEVACTVWSNLIDTAGLRAGELVLLHGGSSGIGTMGIQVAKAVGARVAVTAGSDAKLAACARLGADVLVNYREADFVAAVRDATHGRGADVVLDIIGAKYLARNVEALAPHGRLVVIGLQGGTRAELDLAALLARRASITATSLRARPAVDKTRIVAGTAALVWPLIEDGTIRPVVHAAYPLEQAMQAHTDLAASAHVGKLLLTL